MKRKPEIFFYPKEGAGLLAIHWSEGPFVLGTEPEQGLGVGFFGSKEDLLGVQFFDAAFKSDQQDLVFKNGFSVSVKIENGKVIDLKIKEQKKVA